MTKEEAVDYIRNLSDILDEALTSDTLYILCILPEMCTINGLAEGNMDKFQSPRFLRMMADCLEKQNKEQIALN